MLLPLLLLQLLVNVALASFSPSVWDDIVVYYQLLCIQAHVYAFGMAVCKAYAQPDLGHKLAGGSAPERPEPLAYY